METKTFILYLCSSHLIRTRIFFQIGTGRQMYKGYCRIPYPTTIPGFFGLTDDPFQQLPNSGSKSIGFAARLDGNHQGGIENRKVYRLVTGDFVNEVHFQNDPSLSEKNQEAKEKLEKEKAIHRMMQKLVEIALNPKTNQEDKKKEGESTSKHIPETKDDLQHENDLLSTKIPEVKYFQISRTICLVLYITQCITSQHFLK